MAKNKKKIVNNLLRKQEQAKVKDFEAQKSLMQQFMADEQYVEAMDVMAEMATAGSLDTDVMYWGAKCYYLTQDYERAVKWVNNVLQFDNNNVPARILLAKICFEEGRSQNGLQILELILSKYKGSLSAEDLQKVKNALPTNVIYQKEDLTRYPAVAEVLGLVGKDVVSEQAKPQPVDVAQVPGEASADTAAVLQRLRNLLKQQKTDEVESTPIEDPAPVLAAAEEVPVSSCTEQQSSDSAFSVTDTIQEVMGRPISLAEKIKIINAFAGGCYQADDYENAYGLLTAALKLDAGNQLVLQNFIYTCLAMGKREQAIAMAGELPMVDFALLKALKE